MSTDTKNEDSNQETAEQSAYAKNRPVRSFVIRASRATDSQRKALDAHWDKYVTPFDQTELGLQALFGRNAPLTVEIGFGMGDSLLAMAAADPQRNFLGIEVHQPGVGKLMLGLESQSIDNVRVVCHDATEVLAQALTPSSIDRLQIYFPDPWPKKRHHKRRLVQPEFIALAASRMASGGQLHLATDWEPYAEHMLEVMEASELFSNSNGPGQFWSNPQRPQTKFERRGIRLGHGVWDLLYTRL